MKASATDFSDANSYTNALGEAPGAAPSSADTIHLPAGAVYELHQDTASFGAFVEAAQIAASDGNVVTLNVVDSTAVMSAAFCGTDVYPAPRLVKQGAGALVLAAAGRCVSGGEDRTYLCNLDVNAGDLFLMPDSTAAATRSLGSVKVAQGARLLLPPGTTQAIGITGAGSVTNATESATTLYVQCRWLDPRNTAEFAGSVDGAVKFTANGPGRLSGTLSTTTAGCEFVRTWFGDSTAFDDVVMGIEKFGMAGEPSSIGTAETLYIGRNGASIRFTGQDETTDKSIAIRMAAGYTDRALPARIDGGVHGGLVFSGGSISPVYDNAGFWHTLMELTGSNTSPCAIECPVNSTAYQGHAYPISIKKTGTGVWALRGDASRSGNSGALAVEEGTLQFDSLAPAGTACSLGTGADLYEYLTFKADSADVGLQDAYRIPHAITLGKDGNAGTPRLEFTANTHGTGHGRLIGLAGDACIASSGEIILDGIAAIGAGARRTLTLESASGCEYNEAANITNGEGIVSVVKTGAGKWTLSGEASFTGALIVSNGTLEIRAPAPRPYTWFRFTFRQGWNNTFPNLNELALYTTNGVRKNVGLAYERANYRNSDNYYFYSTPSELPFALARNHATYQNRGENRWDRAERDLQVVFDDAAGQPWVLTKQNSGRDCPLEYDSSRWMPIVMRLDETAGPIVAYDFVAGNASYILKSWTVEGSLDGGDWHTLTNAVFGDASAPAVAAGCWYSDPAEQFASGRILPEGKGFPIPGMCPAPAVAAAQLSGVSSVFVAPGATLSANGSVTLSRLGADPSASESCTIKGFTFASSGVLSLSSAPSGAAVDVPMVFEDVKGLENIANWQVSFDGKMRSGYCIDVADGRLRVRRRGFALLVR